MRYLAKIEDRVRNAANRLTRWITQPKLSPREIARQAIVAWEQSKLFGHPFSFLIESGRFQNWVQDPVLGKEATEKFGVDAANVDPMFASTADGVIAVLGVTPHGQSMLVCGPRQSFSRELVLHIAQQQERTEARFLQAINAAGDEPKTR